MSFDWDDVGTDIPRDRYGRPLVVPPGGGKPVPYTRCTTYAGVLEDTYNLQRWMQRMVAVGLAERPDLVLSVAAHRDDKDELNKICEAALDAAKAHAAAGVGTALHKLCERLDLGQEVGAVPEAYRADITAYEKATAAFVAPFVERFTVLDDLKIGGTPDRVVELGGRRYIADLKTGSIDYGAGKIAMQLAIYSRSVFYDHVTNTRELLNADQDRAIVIHLPAGEGRCELRWVDIAAGWQGVQLAGEVKRWRSLTNRFYALYKPEPAVTLAEQIAAAPTLVALEALWAANRQAWTDTLTAAARQRKQELHQRSLKDFAVSAARK